MVVKFSGVPLDAADITYAGPAPALAAVVIQINFRVPACAAAGPNPVQIIIENRGSNTAAIVVSPP